MTDLRALTPKMDDQNSMKQVLNAIQKAKSTSQKQLAVLIDPDKIDLSDISNFIEKVNKAVITHIFVGGSTVAQGETKKVVTEIKKHTSLPVVLFPGDASQITEAADALLFLSLLSGRNPEYLIGQHIRAIPYLEKASLEVIPTGYVLIDGGKETAVQKVSETKPIPANDVRQAVHTAKAGELSGKQLIYLEAGSGARNPVSEEVIRAVAESITIPLIVGGGIRTKEALQNAYAAGADVVVIGTAFEQDEAFFEILSQKPID